MSSSNGYSSRIRDLPESERPRERLEKYGEASLDSAELLAILIRTGTAKKSAIQLSHELLQSFGGLGRLSVASLHELSKVGGIGRAKACEIKACLELGKRLLTFQEDGKGLVSEPRNVYELLAPDMAHENQEHFKALLLDVKNRITHIRPITTGTLDGTLIAPREVYQEAVSASAASVIVAHNHPSGDPSPSAADIETTRQLKDAGKIVGIPLLDHIIIGKGKFVSFKERGLL